MLDLREQRQIVGDILQAFKDAPFQRIGQAVQGLIVGLVLAEREVLLTQCIEGREKIRGPLPWHTVYDVLATLHPPLANFHRAGLVALTLLINHH